jgi:hypothetical protein
MHQPPAFRPIIIYNNATFTVSITADNNGAGRKYKVEKKTGTEERS